MNDWLKERAVATPHALALIIGTERWTYGDLDRLTDGCCGRLSSIGISAEMFVGVMLPNRLEFVVLVHALARLGAILIPFNVRLTVSELAFQRDHTSCDIILCDASTEEKAAALSAQIFSVDASSSVAHVDILNGQPWVADDVAFSAENLQAIMFTSGTTGAPKGVMLPFANHYASAMASAYRLGVLPSDIWLSCLPLYHVGGLAVIFRSCLYGTAVDLHAKFDVATVSESLDRNPISLISLVPTMVVRLLAHRQGRRWGPALRHLLIGGSMISAELVQQCRALDLPVSTTYSLTEASSQVSTMTPDDVARKPGSTGKPLLFTHLRIVEKNDAGDIVRDCAADEYGEIVVRGPTVMPGYYKNEAATKRTLIADELHTGDIGYLDADGDLWVVQRRSDMIVSGGENVYSAEIEPILRAHPAVKEACVVGVPHPEWGQQVAALVILHDGMAVSAETLQTHCRQQLAGYKLPRIIQFTTAFPQTSSGKTKRPAVIERLTPPIS